MLQRSSDTKQENRLCHLLCPQKLKILLNIEWYKKQKPLKYKDLSGFDIV